jgi:hypothetical protein
MLLFALVLVALPLTQAQELTFKVNEEIDLKRPCFNNGTFCSATAVCNITIMYPDGSTVINNQEMTNQVSFHNVTVNFTLNNQKGTHENFMTCCDAGRCGDDTFDYTVTGTGFEQGSFNGKLIAFAVLPILLIVTSFLFDKKRQSIKVFLIVLAFISIILLMQMAATGEDFDNADRLTTVGVIVAIIIVSFIIAYFFITYMIALFKGMRDAKKRKEEFDWQD